MRRLFEHHGLAIMAASGAVLAGVPPVAAEEAIDLVGSWRVEERVGLCPDVVAAHTVTFEGNDIYLTIGRAQDPVEIDPETCELVRVGPDRPSVSYPPETVERRLSRERLERQFSGSPSFEIVEFSSNQIVFEFVSTHGPYANSREHVSYTRVTR